MIFETIVGRNREDLEKFGKKGIGYIGKHIVGTGEDAHLTTKVYMDLLRPHVILVCGKRGSGKCVTGDTLVYLSDGRLIEIEKLVKDKKEEQNLAFNFENCEITSSRIINFFEREVDEIAEVELWNGLKIKASLNHPFLTLEGWKPLNQLKEDDLVAICREIKIKPSKEMRECELKLLAYIIAKGIVGEKFVWFANKDENIRKDFIKSVEEFDRNLEIKKYGNNLRIGGRFLNWLKKFGLQNKQENFIPSEIFSLPSNQIKIFLKCLFSCKGSLHLKKSKSGFQAVIEYSSKSRKLIEGIYYLLLRFGIVSYIREKKVKNKTYYKLFISGSDVKKFLMEIGFLKNLKLQKAILKKENKYIEKNYDKKRIAKIFGCKEIFSKCLNFVFSPSITWMKIKRINLIKKRTKVYDIEVNDKHNFIGNGIILHNSYSNGVIIEEILSLEKEYLDKTAIVIFDPVGIYWSIKFPNEQQKELLEQWDIKPKGFENVKVYVPKALKESYLKAGIPVDYTISIATNQFTADDWILAFNFDKTSEYAIILSKHINALLETKKPFSIDEIIERIKSDTSASQHTKNVLTNFFEVAKSWGIFEKEGMNINEIVKPGQASIIDLSRVKGEEWGVRNLIAAWITREVYYNRVLARKEEELAKLEGREPKFTFPLTWLIYEEAHNFIPSDKITVSTEPILTIAKQGREPGVSMICITQMPNKLHSDILAQTDLVISFRLTAKSDLDALHTVMQSYVKEELEKHINRLPRGWHGAAIILDDNLERIFEVNIRPRKSWHAGGTAALI